MARPSGEITWPRSPGGPTGLGSPSKPCTNSRGGPSLAAALKITCRLSGSHDAQEIEFARHSNCVAESATGKIVDCPGSRRNHHQPGRVGRERDHPLAVRRQGQPLPVAQADRGRAVGWTEIDKLTVVRRERRLTEEHATAVRGQIIDDRLTEPGERALAGCSRLSCHELHAEVGTRDEHSTVPGDVLQIRLSEHARHGALPSVERRGSQRFVSARSGRREPDLAPSGRQAIPQRSAQPRIGSLPPVRSIDNDHPTELPDAGGCSMNATSSPRGETRR